jgi:D-3-phosphoglycerate dehydrogenase
MIPLSVMCNRRLLSSMKEPETKLICVTTDYVEPDLLWEEGQFRAAGVTFRINNLRLAQTGHLISAAVDADVLIVDQARITAEVIKGLPQCKLIIRHGDGYDNLDLTAATEAGIICINEPGFWSREVAEQAFTLGLSLALKIPVQETVANSPRISVDAGWNLDEIIPCRSLGSQTFGVFGYGKIGSQVASLFRAVSRNILVCDPYVDSSKIKGNGIEPVALEELVARSDIISLHTPATTETIGKFDKNLIARMKKGAMLVNTARGAIVDTDAVTEAIISGQLGGAALDSTVPEPLPASHPLFDLPNVIITPHMGWYSEDALWAMRKQIVTDVMGVLDNRIPETVLNPEVLKRNNLRLIA